MTTWQGVISAVLGKTRPYKPNLSDLGHEAGHYYLPPKTRKTAPQRVYLGCRSVGQLVVELKKCPR